MLYKEEKDLKYTVDIFQKDGVVKFDFGADCGKHHVWEAMADFDITVKELFEILKKWEKENETNNLRT